MNRNLNEKVETLSGSFLREKGLGSGEIFSDACLRLGFPGLIIPEAFGGQGAGAEKVAIYSEALGRSTDQRGPAFSLIGEMLSSTRLLCDFAGEEMKAELLPRIAQGKIRVAHAATESGAGSDLDSLRAGALKTDDGFILNGEKRYVTGGEEADYALVYAVTESNASLLGRLSLFLVPLEAPGVRVEAEPGFSALAGAGTARIKLDNVRLPQSSLIGKPGSACLLFFHCMNWERAGLASFYSGVLHRLLQKCLARVRERESMGVPISQYQSISHPLVRMKADLEAARALAHNAAANLAEGSFSGESASIAKLFATEALASAAQAASQVFGASAFGPESEIAQLVVDAMAFRVASGTNEIQMNRIAKSMGI